MMAAVPLAGAIDREKRAGDPAVSGHPAARAPFVSL
jgi:hypothetical protein